MSAADRWMGWSLRALGRFAGGRVIDRLHLREPTQRLVYHGARAGFRSAGAVTRSFKSVQRLAAPARLSHAAPPSLFDLTPSDEQQMLRDAALSFAMERLRPAALEADSRCQAPAALRAQSGELGLAALGIPEALGGAGAERSPLTQVLVTEALARGDMGLALACLAPVAVSTALTLWGDTDQQARYLPAFVGDDPPAAALALLEPQALFDPYALSTRARAADGGYRLDGVKALVPLAAQAELFVVAAALDGQGPALFLVESSSPGLSVEAEPAMGLRAAATGRLRLDGVSLPGNARLGDCAAAVYDDCVQLARLGWCALAVGTAQAALDYLIPYCNERSAFGEPISHRQSVAFALADMSIELEGMRLATWRAASRAGQGLPFAREAALARRLCAEKGARVGSDAVQLLGGHGFVKEHPAERWYRDLRAVGLMEGALLV